MQRVMVEGADGTDGTHRALYLNTYITPSAWPLSPASVKSKNICKPKYYLANLSEGTTNQNESTLFVNRYFSSCVWPLERQVIEAETSFSVSGSIAGPCASITLVIGHSSTHPSTLGQTSNSNQSDTPRLLVTQTPT